MTYALRERLQASLGSGLTLERELGGGGMSRVFLAEDTRLRRRVVVKVLSPEMAEGLSVERFEREVLLAAALQEPHIVPLLSAGEIADEHGPIPYYTMPFVDGPSLRARMASGPVPPGEAVSILCDVARALAYAHRRSVVHHDVKPENVLLSEGTAVVSDFGIAKALQASRTQAPGGTLTEIGTSLGTPAYMAPEQAAGDPDVDHRADLYAWGVVGYELLAGKHPFAGKTAPHQWLAAHLTETPPPLSGASRASPTLAALVMRALAKNPADRPASADEILRALEAPAPPARSAARAPLAIASVLAIASLLTIAAFITWWARLPHVRVGVGGGPRGAESTGVGPSAAEGAITSVAVLPFANVGGNTEDEYFSDGMADELAHALARLPSLRVAGRTSSFSFKGKAVPAPEIGRTLGVSGIVGGSVRRSGRRLRVTAQLVSARDGTVRWDGVYESRSRDVFAVQDSLTHAIVTALVPVLHAVRDSVVARDSIAPRPPADAPRTEPPPMGHAPVPPPAPETAAPAPTAPAPTASAPPITPITPRDSGRVPRRDSAAATISVPSPPVDPARGTGDMEAYDLYMRGRYSLARRDAAGLRRAASYFRQAVARDPSFARAHAGLALAYDVQPDFDTGVRVDSVNALAIASARRALRLDSTSADAHTALGYALMVRYDLVGAESHFATALRLQPRDATAHHWHAFSLQAAARLDDALAELHAAQVLDPLSPSIASSELSTLLALRRFDEVITRSRRVLSLDTAYAAPHGTRSLAFLYAGQPDSALVEARTAWRLDSLQRTRRGQLVVTLAAAARWDEAARARAALLRDGAHASPVDLALAALVSGDSRAALGYVAQMFARHELFVTSLGAGCDPRFDPLKNDPRFVAMFAPHGLAVCPQRSPWPITPRPH